jgi:hypothetical protein
MSLKHLARHALSLPFHIAVAKSAAYAGCIIKSHVRQVTENWRCSYQPLTGVWLYGVLGRTGLDLNDAMASNLRALSVNIIDHRFDLLGSDWVSVSHTPDVVQLSPGNRDRSAAIREMINSNYLPIDWQLDFKSGYRWREDRLSGTLRYGHEPGVDVKVPWELGRLQHLPWLAMQMNKKSTQEFRNQVLDFAAANPPGYGVNWLCTMDVAIRAANFLMAYDLFVNQGAQFDEGFLGEFHALIMAHGKHIMGNLEWHDLHRANHYLADVVGLLFVAAYLPRSSETDGWLAFAVQQLVKEVERQFTPDGANFEASTSYHRLSAEMALYGTALVLGLSDDKRAALLEYDHCQCQEHPSVDPAPIALYPIPGSDKTSPFPDSYFERLERMAEFIIHVTKPNGRIAQIGDNDSGRFFKLCPSFVEIEKNHEEQHLDHRSTVAAINGLWGRQDFTNFAGPKFAVETSIVGELAKGQKVASYLNPGDNLMAMNVRISKRTEVELSVMAETIIELPDATILSELTACAYPDFGLYIWRSPCFFLSVRCGPVGQNGNGGHAHNDQLAIELMVDGEEWIADPGTYLYTPSPKDRDAYRSVHAHGAPKIGDKEPSRLDFGLFRLEDNMEAHCLSFDNEGFEGMHIGYGVPLHRCIKIEAGRINITDKVPGNNQSEARLVTVSDGAALRELWSLTLPFSAGYGLREIE